MLEAKKRDKKDLKKILISSRGGVIIIRIEEEKIRGRTIM